MTRARIIGTGAYYPEGRLSNADLAQMVETSDEWIVERTGIRERHLLEDLELATSDMAAAASREALAMAGLDAGSLELIVLGTVTPDMMCPSGAVRVQEKLGASRAFAFDVSAACAGSLIALDVATSQIETGRVRNALVIGTETLSRIVDYSDRNTCILFGDAAGAMVLGAEDTGERGVLDVVSHTDGRQWELIHIPAGGSAMPGSAGVDDPAQFTLRMAGREVFKFAVRALQDVTQEILGRCGVTSAEVDWVVAHQANMRIIEALATRLAIPTDRFINNIHRTGNTSSASVPCCLDEGVRDGRIKDGDLVLMMAVGAGMAWSAALVRW